MRGAMNRRMTGLVLAAAVAVAGFVVSATPAAAADVTPTATCHAGSCHGTNPSSTGCAVDAITARSATSPEGITVQLRYSPTCRSAWGRILNGIPGDRVRVQRDDGANFPATISTGTTVYTAQVNDAGYTSKACVRAYITNSLTCTGSY